MSKSTSTKRISFGLLGWIFLVLFWLKLNPGGNFTTPVADMSWWLVTVPLWGPLALVLGIFIIVFVSAVVVGIGKGK